ncbi:hypothetical protein IKD98_02105 [Candidatus Saccharibacteria bacterium]|nr:hypothetical protein [Candidatus Saccharibacteria bacterium]
MNNVAITLDEKKTLRLKALRFLTKYGNNIENKLINICSKTGRHSVPEDLWQNRTPRKNRCLISWKAVKDNNMTFEQLDSFEGGIVVEFINNDFFNKENYSDPLFVKLKARLGSNENVSAIISIKTEDGSSSSSVPREAFKKLTNNTEVEYNGQKVIISKSNYKDYALKQNITRKGQGNETWSGFLYVSIRGGQQDTIQTHAHNNLTLFNPACDYASSDVIEDIYLVMIYYVLVSINGNELKNQSHEEWKKYVDLMKKYKEALKKIEYDFKNYRGNLFDFVKNHYSVSFLPGRLLDPIQMKEISIDEFDKKTREGDSIDVTHSEAVVHERYYWDKKKKCILSPGRPTNIFWSYHYSNMLQQDYDLDEFFEKEKIRYEKRQKMLKNQNKFFLHNS